MTDKIIIDGKEIGCPCYIDRPLYRYDKACLIQSQAFTEQQTEEKPILRCDEIQNCPIKKLYKQLKHKEQECKTYGDYLYEAAKLLGIPLGISLNAEYSPEHLAIVSMTINNYIKELQAEKQKVEELEKELEIMYRQALEEIKGLAQSINDDFEHDDIEQQLHYCKEIAEQIVQKCEMLENKKPKD